MSKQSEIEEKYTAKLEFVTKAIDKYKYQIHKEELETLEDMKSILTEVLDDVKFLSLPPQSPSLVSEEEIEAMAVANHPDGMRGLGFIEGFKKCLSLVKEGEKDSEDLALKFAEWLDENDWTQLGINEDGYWQKVSDCISGYEFKTTPELYQIFKQEQQKTGNNG